MATCKYIYCRAAYDDREAECAACGYPVDAQSLRDYDYLLSRALALDLGEIVDMHQIIRNEVGALDTQLRFMRDIGVTKALLQSVPVGFSAIWGNDKLPALQKSHAGSFWISSYIDPREPDALHKLKCLANEGIKVVKLVPCIGFRADDPTLAEFWEAMEKLALVAMVHTGFITARHKELERRQGTFLNSRFGRPIYFDEPARRYPDLQIILCHLGGSAWYHEAAQMVTEHSNVWGDISGFGLIALRRILADGLPLNLEKVFWGNDASPNTYPFNLRLAMNALRASGLEAMATMVFRETGQKFASRHF